MNYQLSGSFHTLTHWQNGTGSSGSGNDKDKINTGLYGNGTGADAYPMVLGLYKDGELALLPYAFHDEGKVLSTGLDRYGYAVPFDEEPYYERIFYTEDGYWKYYSITRTFNQLIPDAVYSSIIASGDITYQEIKYDKSTKGLILQPDTATLSLTSGYSGKVVIVTATTYKNTITYCNVADSLDYIPDSIKDVQKVLVSGNGTNYDLLVDLATVIEDETEKATAEKIANEMNYEVPPLPTGWSFAYVDSNTWAVNETYINGSISVWGNAKDSDGNSIITGAGLYRGVDVDWNSSSSGFYTTSATDGNRTSNLVYTTTSEGGNSLYKYPGGTGPSVYIGNGTGFVTTIDNAITSHPIYTTYRIYRRMHRLSVQDGFTFFK